MKQPTWAHLNIPPIDYQDIIYYAAPKKRKELQSLDEVDPELLDTFNKLGISLDEQKRLTGVAVDAVMDSTSVKTTFQDTLSKHGIIFMSFSEAVKQYPDLVKKYLTYYDIFNHLSLEYKNKNNAITINRKKKIIVIVNMFIDGENRHLFPQCKRNLKNFCNFDPDI